MLELFGKKAGMVSSQLCCIGGWGDDWLYTHRIEIVPVSPGIFKLYPLAQRPWIRSWGRQCLSLSLNLFCIATRSRRSIQFANISCIACPVSIGKRGNFNSSPKTIRPRAQLTLPGTSCHAQSETPQYLISNPIRCFRVFRLQGSIATLAS